MFSKLFNKRRGKPNEGKAETDNGAFFERFQAAHENELRAAKVNGMGRELLQAMLSHYYYNEKSAKAQRARLVRLAYEYAEMAEECERQRTADAILEDYKNKEGI